MPYPTDDQLGVVGAVLFAAGFALLRPHVFRFHAALVSFEIIGLEIDGADHVLASLGSSLHRPGFLGSNDVAVLQVERLHHLADKTVGQDDGGIAIFVRKFESQDREVGHFLYGGRRKHEIAIVAVASALDHGKVVALLRSDVAQPRAGAHDINNDAGEFGAREIGDALLHEAYSRSGRTSHHANARRRCAVHHVDGSRLALRLDETCRRLAGR